MKKKIVSDLRLGIFKNWTVGYSGMVLKKDSANVTRQMRPFITNDEIDPRKKERLRFKILAK